MLPTIAIVAFVCSCLGFIVGYVVVKIRFNKLDNALVLSERLLKKLKKGQKQGRIIQVK